jgi:hypothetical protein
MGTISEIAEPKLTTTEHVEQVVRSAHLELTELLRQRAEIMQRIGTVKKILFGLSTIYGESVLGNELWELLEPKPRKPERGLTQACRSVLMYSDVPLDARAVIEELEKKSPQFIAHHKNPIASVRIVLNRLVAYAEVRSFRDKNRRLVWEWISDRRESTVEVG